MYFLRSQVHETLQAKVTVMECVGADVQSCCDINRCVPKADGASDWNALGYSVARKAPPSATVASFPLALTDFTAIVRTPRPPFDTL